MGLTLQPHNYGPTPLHAASGEMATFSMDVLGDGSSAYTSFTGTVSILDANGNTVRTLTQTTAPNAQGNARFNFTWDGKDDHGNPVQPGDYGPTFGALAAVAGQASQAANAVSCSGLSCLPPFCTRPCDDGGDCHDCDPCDDDQQDPVPVCIDDATRTDGSSGSDFTVGSQSTGNSYASQFTSGGQGGAGAYTGPEDQNPAYQWAHWLETVLHVPNINVPPPRIGPAFDPVGYGFLSGPVILPAWIPPPLPHFPGR